MIKSDINLLPRKKKIPLSVTLGIIFSITGFILLVAVGVFVPASSLKIKHAELDSLKQVLAGYDNVQSDFITKTADLKILQQQQLNYNSFEKTDIQTLELMNQINAIKPETVTIDDQSYNNLGLTLAGYATNDIEIARFEVALRKMGLFSEITLESISGLDGERTFTFTLKHKVTDPQAEGGNN